MRETIRLRPRQSRIISGLVKDVVVVLVLPEKPKDNFKRKEREQMKRITGHLTEKNKKWYAVINLYDTDGKRKEKWQGLNLDANKGNKREAE